MKFSFMENLIVYTVVIYKYKKTFENKKNYHTSMQTDEKSNL